MPVSTGCSLGEPRAKRCKLCDESKHRSESGSGFWQLQLDRDLVDTISAIYPEWFKNNMAEEQSSIPRESPPKAVVDTSPLHIDQNKESLKVKLMLRRPFDQLVAQGIMPPHKTPAAYHGQRRQLERAKTGDMLKAKIQQRPPRQELERRHILEADPGHVDPSLAERQRMLKKARLADQLNDQLSHRPGPLELIQKNILHTEETIEQAVKTGRIPYKATSEGQLNRPQHPLSYITPEDDSQSSEGDNIVSPGPSDVLETAAKSAGIVVSLIPSTEGTVVLTSATPTTVLNKDNSEIVFADLCRSVTAPLLSQQQHQPTSASSPASLVSSTSTLSPLSSVASPVPSVVSQPATPAPPPPPVTLTPRPIQSPAAKSDAPGKDKNRKKCKSKTAPKARTIKFHEYKGPPSAQKNSNNNSISGESSYDLLLQQQTLLLQFQLQLQHKYPQIILPASQKSNSESNNNLPTTTINSLPSPAPSSSSESLNAARLTGRLEDMKVSDLKAELKRRNLPVSGPKPQLIERLKPFTSNDHINQNIASVDSTHSNSSLDQLHNSPQYQDGGSPQGSIKDEQSEQMDIAEPLSPMPPQKIQEKFQLLQQQLAQQDNSQKAPEDIVREQQRQIEQLQRELTLSKLKLQEATRVEPKAQLLALQKHVQARQQQQQQQQHIALQMQQLQALQARQPQVNEEQQRIQQQQHVAFQNQKNLSANSFIINGANATLLFNLMQEKGKLGNNHIRANSLPNVLSTIVTPVIATTEVKTDFIEEVKPPPPLYEEATKQINKKNIKSQTVDDVLEILIKNGELPPSAAQDPQTPSTAGSKSIAPVFPSQSHRDMDSNSPEAALGLDPNELLETINFDNVDFTQLMMDVGETNHTNTDNNNLQDNESVPMDTDDWLESLCVDSNVQSSANDSCTVPQDDLVGYDPLLGITQEPFDPFDPFNLEEYRSPADLTASLSWDKVDYAA